jgi:hypothetical protein
MSQSESVLHRHNPMWFRLFAFHAEAEEFPHVDELKSIGVREIAIQYGRASDGSLFTNVSSVAAETGQEVDVSWLIEVRDVCERLGPQLFVAASCLAGPDEDGNPETDVREMMANGDLLLFVTVWTEKESHLLVDVAVPSADLVVAEEGE